MFKSLSCDSLGCSERSPFKRKQTAAIATGVTLEESSITFHSLFDLNRNILPPRQHCELSCHFTAKSVATPIRERLKQRRLSGGAFKMDGTTVRAFENDDYDYLINCKDLITTCQEALQENNFEPESDHVSLAAKPPSTPTLLTPKQQYGGVGVGGGSVCLNCEENSSQRSPSSAASSGLGLSLEEDLSLKYCHSDEEFSSLNSTTTSNENYSAKALMAEFIEWLDYIENQLDSVCYCAKIATAAAASSTSSASTNAARSVSERESKISDHSPIAATSDCHSSSELSLSRVSQKPASSLHIDSAGVEEKHLTEIEEIPAFHVVEEGEEEAIDEDVEAEELLMSLQPMTSSKLRASSTKLCLPETVDDWTVISARHSAFQNEFEKIAHRFIKDINQVSKPASASGANTHFKSLRQQEKRCHKLWLKSLEYLLILQQYSGQRCPRHYSIRGSLNGNSANAKLTGTANKSTAASTQSTRATANCSASPLSRSYNSIFTSTPYISTRRYYPPASLHTLRGHTRKVELKSTGTGGSSVSIQNRRVQTRGSSGTTMIDQQDPIDPHSMDGSGSPGGDSGVFSSSADKYEIIQKDIGYSSDADMSDAIEAHPHSADQSSSNRSTRKRQVRRRRTRTNRVRPWSYHADWTDWDYYQTPFDCSVDNLNDETDYDNENIIRKLTEFGENYETWINSELDNDELKLVSKPAVVIEKPEMEAFCEMKIVTKADACISTSPLPTPYPSDKESTADDEPEGQKVANVLLLSVNESKSTQTAVKAMTDSACNTVPQLVKREGLSGQQQQLACKTCASTAKSFSSLKFYTSLALAGLLAFLFAVTQFPPDIQKTYTRPPPI